MPQYDIRELRGNNQFNELMNLPVKETEYPLPEGPSRIGEALTEGLKAFPQLGLSALDLGASLGSGMVAWPLGKLAGGVVRGVPKMLGSKQPAEEISAGGELTELRVNEFLSIPPGTIERYGKELLPSVFDTSPELGRIGGEAIGTGIEKGMEFIQEKAIPAIPLFNVPKVSELAKTNPNEAWLLATVEELVTFGLLGKGFRVTKNRLLGKSPKDWTAKDWADAERLRQKVKEAKQNEKAPQHLLEAPDEWIDGEYTVEPQRPQSPGPQRLLEAPREGAPGGGTDLAPEGPPPPGLKPAPKRTLQPGEKVEIGTPTQRPPAELASKDLGSNVRTDGVMKQGDGSEWHGFTFTDGPAEGGSFTVVKKSGEVVTPEDIVSAGSKILEQRKSPVERMEEALTPSQVSSRLPEDKGETPTSVKNIDKGKSPLDMPDFHISEKADIIASNGAENYSVTILENRYGVRIERRDKQEVFRVRGPQLPEEGVIVLESQLSEYGLQKPWIGKYKPEYGHGEPPIGATHAVIIGPKDPLEAGHIFVARVRKKLGLTDEQTRQVFLTKEYTDIAVPEIRRRFEAGDRNFLDLADRFAERIRDRISEGTLKLDDGITDAEYKKHTPSKRLMVVPKKGASPETLQKARASKAEKAKSKIGGTEITPDMIKEKRTPEQAEGELRALVPEVRDYLDGKVADPSGVRGKINEILSDLDPNNTLHSDVLGAGERMLTEISKKERPFVEPEEGGELYAERLRENERQVPERRIENGRAEGIEKESVVMDHRQMRERYRAIEAMTNTSGGSTAIPVIYEFRNLFSPEELNRLYTYFENNSPNRQNVREVAKEAGINNLVDNNKVRVEEPALIEPTPKSGAQEGPITFSKVKPGLYKSSDGEVYIGKENGKWWLTDKDGNVQNDVGYKSLREAKTKYSEIMREAVVEEMLPTKSEVWNSEDVRKYMEELAGEEKISGEELEARLRDIEKTPTDIEDFLYGEAPKDRFFFDQGESLDGYTIKDAARDAWEFSKGIFTDESGSISFGDLSPEDIARLDRLRRKAKQMGEDLGDFLRKAGYAEKDIIDIMEFVKKYLDTPVISGPDPNVNRLDMADDAILFQERRTLRAEGQRSVPIDITMPPYYAKYLKGWWASKDIKIGQVPGAKWTKYANEFTLPYSRVFERGIDFLRSELYDFYNAQRKKEGVRLAQVMGESRYWRTLLDNKKRSAQRIYDYAVSQQEGGEGLLAANGRVVPKLNPTEMQIYEGMVRRMEEVYPEVVKARIESGKNPFKREPHYFTFARAVAEEAKAGTYIKDKDTRPLVGDEEFIDQNYMRVKSVPFAFDKSRVKEPSYKLKDDAFEIYERYMRATLRTIHIAPVAAKAHTMLSPVRVKGKKVFDPRYQRPNTFRNINRWAWDISGVPAQRDIIQFRKPVEGLQSRIASAMLLGNFRTGFIQLSALRNTIAATGEINTLDGIRRMTLKSLRDEMMQRSNHMLVRSFDSAVYDSLGDLQDMKLKDVYLPENFKDFKRQLGKMIAVPDAWAAGVSWWAKIAELEKKGITGEKAAIEADNFVINTQGSGDIGHRSAIQNRVWGKVFTTFQTFVINDFRFLLEDVLGFSRNTSLKTIIPRLLRYLFYTAAYNYVTEDVLKIKTPFPRPIKVGWEGYREGKPYYDIAVSVLKELSEPILFISSIRYGKPVTGVMSEVINNVFTGGKYGVTSYQELVAAFKKGRIPVETLKTIGIFLGVPGTSQLVKSYRAYKRGEIPWNVFWGNFTQHVQKYAPPQRSRRARRIAGPPLSVR